MMVASAQIFSALLVATGFAKMRRPGDTGRALTALGLPKGRMLAGALGLTELTLGLAALLAPHPALFACQAILYGGFVVWVAMAIRNDLPIESCGCLGRDDTPPYWGHLLVDIAGAAASLSAVFAFSTIPQGIGLNGEFAFWSVIVVGAALAWLVIGEGARANAEFNR